MPVKIAFLFSLLAIYSETVKGNILFCIFPLWVAFVGDVMNASYFLKCGVSSSVLKWIAGHPRKLPLKGLLVRQQAILPTHNVMVYLPYCHPRSNVELEY